MWAWSVIRPKAATNYLADPAFRALAVTATGNPWAPAGGSAVSTVAAYRGPASVCLTGAGGVAIRQDVTVPAQTSVTASAWFLVTAGTVTLQIVAHDLTVPPTVLGSAVVVPSPYWQRVTCTGALGGRTTFYFGVRCSGSVTGYVDCCQLEDGSTPTTYIDGDEPGCVWRGRPQLSESFRPLSCRTGGVVVPFSTYVHETSMQGWGRYTQSNVTVPFGLQGGSVYQRSVREARVATITGEITAPPPGGTMDDLHNASASLGRLFTSEREVAQTPVRLVYDSGAAGAQTLYADAVYDSGLEFDSLEGLSLKTVAMRFLCPDPRMTSDAENSVSFGEMTYAPYDVSMYYRRGGSSAFEPVADSGISGVLCGAWVTPPYGDSALDSKLLLGGSFTSPGTRLAYFDPRTGTLSSAGFGPSNGQVNAICQTGDYVWIGGTFTSFSGYAYLVRYKLSTGAIDQPVACGNNVRTLSYDPVTDTLYVGGDAFTTPANFLFSVQGPRYAGGMTVGAVQWSGLTTGIPGTSVTTVGVFDSCVDSQGSLYILQKVSGSGGGFVGNLWVQKGAVAATTWSILGHSATTTTGATPQGGSMKWGPDGMLYLLGSFTGFSPGDSNIHGMARFNGGAWQGIGPQGAFNSLSVTWGRSIEFDRSGIAHMAGHLYPPGLSNPGSPSNILALSCPDSYLAFDGGSNRAQSIGAIASGTTIGKVPMLFMHPSDDSVLFVGNDSTNCYVFPVVPTTVFYEGTAPAPVRATLRNTSPYYTVQIGGLRNERTGQGVYFDMLTVSPGETVVVDTDPNAATVTSDARGDLSAFVSPGSDSGSMVLVEGDNDVTLLWGLPGSDPQSAYLDATLSWHDRHAGVDGTGTGIAAP